MKMSNAVGATSKKALQAKIKMQTLGMKVLEQSAMPDHMGVVDGLAERPMFCVDEIARKKVVARGSKDVVRGSKDSLPQPSITSYDLGALERGGRSEGR